MRYVVINYSANPLRVIRVKVQLQRTIRASQLRVLVAELEKSIIVLRQKVYPSFQKGEEEEGLETGGNKKKNSDRLSLPVAQDQQQQQQLTTTSTSRKESFGFANVAMTALAASKVRSGSARIQSSTLEDGSHVLSLGEDDVSHGVNPPSGMTTTAASDLVLGASEETRKVTAKNVFDDAFVFVDDSYSLILGVPVQVLSLSQFYKEQSDLYFRVLEILEKFNAKVQAADFLGTPTLDTELIPLASTQSMELLDRNLAKKVV